MDLRLAHSYKLLGSIKASMAVGCLLMLGFGLFIGESHNVGFAYNELNMARNTIYNNFSAKGLR